MRGLGSLCSRRRELLVNGEYNSGGKLEKTIRNKNAKRYHVKSYQIDSGLVQVDFGLV